MSWLTDFLLALPIAGWVFIGIGIPSALILLPRHDWGHRTLVVVVGFASGSALVTLWLWLLGTLGSLYSPQILTGMIGMTLVGVAGAFRKHHTTAMTPIVHDPLKTLDRMMLAGVMLFTISVTIATAFWVFTAYDTLWVYGYQGRLYALTHSIPATIGYYPPQIALLYALPQILLGSINDHYARVSIPFFVAGSAMAAYVLGSRVFKRRRIGIFCMALWVFYPHFASWAQMGDLEIALTFTFTLCSTLFAMAWFERDDSVRRRYALLAGLALGVALWTKPTAGAFVWGVILVTGVELLRVRNIRMWYPRFEVAALTGVACLPLGGLWYIRNLVLGHPAIDYPPATWLTLARRSGDLLSWGALALTLLVLFTLLQHRSKLSRQHQLLLVVGILLVLVGTMASVPLLNPARLNPPASYLSPMELAAVALGSALIAWVLLPFAKCASDVARTAFCLMLALPYFLTYFYAYSYDPRLSFAIVPLLIVPSAVILSHMELSLHPYTKRLGAILVVTAMALYALFPIVGFRGEPIESLWDGRYPDDTAKYRATNPSLMILADALDAYKQETGIEPVLVAPGEQQLRFFFPLMRMDNVSRPTGLDELSGATHYLYGTLAGWWYGDVGISSAENQIVSALGRSDIMTRVTGHDDATFRYELYALHLDARQATQEINYILPEEAAFGEVARLVGIEQSTSELRGQRVYMRLLWQVDQSAQTDYTMVFTLVNENTQEPAYTWRSFVAESPFGHYRTTLWQPGESILWQPGESILENRLFSVDTPIVQGVPYRLRLSWQDADGNTIPVVQAGITRDYFQFPAIYTYGGL